MGLVPATPEELAAFAAVLGPGRRLVGALLMFDCKATDGSGKVKWAPQPGGVQEVMGTLARIEGKVDVVGGKVDVVLKDYQEVKTAKERLQEMAAAGLLRFSKRVDAESVRVTCAVLASGDLAKAARAAKFRYSTMRDLIAGWERRGKDYAILADLVRWRKQMRFRGTVPLDETVLTGETPDTDYAGLLSDVLDGLLAMTEENWREKCEDLADLLRSGMK